MTQAPTPGPLSAQQEEAIAFNLCSLHGFDPAFVTTQRDFAFAVIREYERARPSLAPTAPVEASGSEREEIDERTGHPTHYSHAPQPSGSEREAPRRKFSTPVAQAAYDVFRREGWMRGDIDRFYVQGFHNISKPERSEGSTRAAVWWAGRDRATSGLPSGIPEDRGALRPQPSGETREADALVNAPIAMSDREERMRKALNRQCDNMAFVLDRVDLRAWSEKFSHELAKDRQALSTTPARAEAQDEGAAGEAVAKVVRKGFSTGSISWTKFGQDADLPDETLLYAHPSPTPAADADRVRIARKTEDCPDCGAPPLHLHKDDCPTLAALKSTAAQEGGTK